MKRNRKMAVGKKYLIDPDLIECTNYFTLSSFWMLSRTYFLSSSCTSSFFIYRRFIKYFILQMLCIVYVHNCSDGSRLGQLLGQSKSMESASARLQPVWKSERISLWSSTAPAAAAATTPTAATVIWAIVSGILLKCTSIFHQS